MDILAEVKQIIAKAMGLPIEQLTSETKLEDLGVASVDVIEIIFELEEKFNITIPLKLGEGSLAVKPEAAGAGTADLGFGTIADIAHAVKTLVDAKAD